MSSFAALFQKAENARHYQALRADFPGIPAKDIWGFMQNQGHEASPLQYVCNHKWSSGYYDDGEFDRECAIVCVHCGLSGDI